MTETATYLPPRGGLSYDWENDNIFIKVSAAESGGAYTLVEDNLKASFALGLHMHETHAETFYVLEGRIDFHINGAWQTAEPGACVHVPPKVPHAARVTPGEEAARMLMIFQPAGFDQFLAEMASLSEADFADETRMAELNARYDIVPLGPVPA